MTEPEKTPMFRPLSGDLVKSRPDEDKLSMNHFKQGNLKRAHMLVLRNSHPAPFGKIVLGELDNVGSEAGIRVALPGDPDAIDLNKTRTENGGKFSMTRLVAKYPDLKVAKGWVRLFPVSTRVIEGRTCLVLNLRDTLVELAKSRGKGAAPQKKKEEHPQSPGGAAASEQDENE